MKPPKDGEVILIVFKGDSTPRLAMWNGANQDWAVAMPQVDMYRGKMNDYYWETESRAEEELEFWKPMERFKS